MVSGTRGPIPIAPEAAFSEWRNFVDYRLKALEAGFTDKKGIVARQDPLTSNSSTWTASSSTDHSIIDVEVSVLRLYLVRLHTAFTVSGSGRWIINFYVDGALTQRLDDIDTVPYGSVNGLINASVLWTPPDGVNDLEVRVSEVVDGSSLVFAGAATAERQFWIEDLGLR